MNITNPFKSVWNVFFTSKKDSVINPTPNHANTYLMSPAYSRPSRNHLSRANEMTILAGLYSRIAMDVASIDIHHVTLDEYGNYVDIVHSELEDRLNLSTNMDQIPYSFKLDLVLSLFDEGCIAIVPTETEDEINEDGNYDVYSMRVARITKWFPRDVEVEIYNEDTMQKERVIVSKNVVCIIENPFFSIMNEPNSIVRRIIRKLAQIDGIDEKLASNKLNLILQFPYTIRGEQKRQLAEERRNDLENQLAKSHYGIGYIDATEHVTQLNIPAENQLLKEIEMLNTQLYGELGLTQSILDGTADSETILHYENKAVYPVLQVICQGLQRTFLSKEAIKTKKQAIRYFKDLFKHVSIENMADMCDKLSRNEILTGNEIRSGIGYRPSSDPRANQLLNKNISHDESENEQSEDKQNLTKGRKNQNEG